jgi:glucose-6-phosphate 1-dehydrogenase
MASDTSQRLSSEPRPADVLVVFGITGDLAKVMTFRSLYRLEMRKLLDCPIVGVAVDDWTVDKLQEHARECIEGTGEVLDKEAERLSYVRGDFSDAAVYGRVADAIKGKESPVFYLEIPPFLFGTVVKGLSDVDAPPPVHPYAQGSWGPDAADELVAGHGRWHEPWVTS